MSTEPGRRQRKKLEARERLIECAATLFASRGYEATTMEDIGEAADVSRATVFNYFARKEDLVLAWFDSRRADLAAGLGKSDGDSGNARDRLQKTFRHLARIFEVDPRIGRGMVRAWLLAGGALLTPDSDTSLMFADMVRAGQRDGDFARGADADVAGRLLFDVYIGVLCRWVTARREQPVLEDGLLAVLDLVLSGIAPRRSARS